MRLSVGTRRSRDAQPLHSAATRLLERWPASRCALPAALTTCEPRPALTAVCWYPKIPGRAFGEYALLATWSGCARRQIVSLGCGRPEPGVAGREWRTATESAPNRGNLFSVDQVPTLKWQATVFGFGRTVTCLETTEPGFLMHRCTTRAPRRATAPQWRK